MKVKNLNNTSTKQCYCASWLEHWLKYGGLNMDTCSVSGCNNPPAVGGHVQMDSDLDKSWYIIPLCAACNSKRGQDLEIWHSMLVSANVSETCGRPKRGL